MRFSCLLLMRIILRSSVQHVCLLRNWMIIVIQCWILVKGVFLLISITMGFSRCMEICIFRMREEGIFRFR